MLLSTLINANITLLRHLDCHQTENWRENEGQFSCSAELLLAEIIKHLSIFAPKSTLEKQQLVQVFLLSCTNTSRIVPSASVISFLVATI
mmetsp:Transcript_9874/g.14190  ORF Transcript_9874/g.14190 Transcript_9874/m.14190 type:complete len:90 (-) Transcript_9874:174-443(-)